MAELSVAMKGGCKFQWTFLTTPAWPTRYPSSPVDGQLLQQIESQQPPDEPQDSVGVNVLSLQTAVDHRDERNTPVRLADTGSSWVPVVISHIGYVPYKTGGKCMACMCTATYSLQKLL